MWNRKQMWWCEGADEFSSKIGLNYDILDFLSYVGRQKKHFSHHTAVLVAFFFQDANETAKSLKAQTKMRVFRFGSTL